MWPGMKGTYTILTPCPTIVASKPYFSWNQDISRIEPCHEKTCLRGLRPGKTQTCLRSNEQQEICFTSKFSETIFFKQIIPKLVKNEIKYSITNGENFKRDILYKQNILGNLNLCFITTRVLWRHEIFPKCSVVPTPCWYKCKKLQNQTTDLYGLFSLNSYDITLFRCYLSVYQWDLFWAF